MAKSKVQDIYAVVDQAASAFESVAKRIAAAAAPGCPALQEVIQERVDAVSDDLAWCAEALEQVSGGEELTQRDHGDKGEIVDEKSAAKGKSSRPAGGRAGRGAQVKAPADTQASSKSTVPVPAA